MDIEKLTKQQIILVTLLVSFVTSIATGIVTVALMDQAPVGMTQTINRVVERTIEKVVTEPAKNNNSAAVITRETIVVKEDDKVVESVAKNKDSIVRIYTKSDDVSSREFVGLGTIISKEGLVATGLILSETKNKYLLTLDNNHFYDVIVSPRKENADITFLKIQSDEKNPSTFSPVVFSDSDSLKLGQTVIAWGGQSQNSVSTGIISSLIDKEVIDLSATTTNATSSSTFRKEISAINTNINSADSLPGAPLLNLYGEMVGIRVNNSLSSAYSFLPANILKQEMNKII